MKKLLKFLKEGDTEERCGLVFKTGRVIETKNISETPESSFEIDVNDLLKHEERLTGTWHTHPHGSSVYSMMDHVGFTMWPQLTHWIIGTDGVSAYIVKDGIVYNAD